MSQMMTEAEIKTLPADTLVESAMGIVYTVKSVTGKKIVLAEQEHRRPYLTAFGHPMVHELTIKQAARILVTE